MNSPTIPVQIHARTSSSARAIDWLQTFWGGLLIAVGDVCLALFIWFHFDFSKSGLVFQSIAVGVLGKASFDDGLTSEVLGAALHLFMATMFVVVYVLVARRVPALLRQPYVLGPLYGVVIYIVMNFVVLPLSRVGRFPSFAHIDWIVYSVLGHIVFGIIAVVFARRALRNVV